MNAKQSETWENIISAGEQAAYAYQQMVRAADELANEIGYNEDYVLRQVLPKTMGERRDCERVLIWLNSERAEIEAHVLGRQAAREREAKREALLARLNLSEEEQRLLGVAEVK